MSHDNRRSVSNKLHFTSSLESSAYAKSTTLYAVHMHPKALTQARSTTFSISLVVGRWLTPVGLSHIPSLVESVLNVAGFN